MNFAIIRNPLRLLAFASSILFLFVFLFLFYNTGRFMVISDPLPQHLDLIFTFAGDNLRVAYSRELNLKYSDCHWILSDYKNGYSRLLRKSNYNMSKVHIIDTCQSTVSEINALNKWIKDNKFLFDNQNRLSVGLISSPYHMRRIQLMINREFKKQDIRFHYLPVPLIRYNWTENMFQYWWKSGTVSRAVISEIQKIIYFLLIS